MSTAFPSLEHDSGIDEQQPVFAEPWEAHAFAIAVILSEKGLLKWSQWSDAMAEEIKKAEVAEAELQKSELAEMIKSIVAKPEVGKTYKGKVVKIMEFGAFVNFLGKQDGLVHISQLAANRVEKVTDVVKEGDEVAVKVIGFDRGKVKLSIKEAV